MFLPRFESRHLHHDEAVASNSGSQGLSPHSEAGKCIRWEQRPRYPNDDLHIRRPNSHTNQHHCSTVTKHGHVNHARIDHGRPQDHAKYLPILPRTVRRALRPGHRSPSDRSSFRGQRDDSPTSSVAASVPKDRLRRAALHLLPGSPEQSRESRTRSAGNAIPQPQASACPRSNEWPRWSHFGAPQLCIAARHRPIIYHHVLGHRTLNRERPRGCHRGDGILGFRQNCQLPSRPQWSLPARSGCKTRQSRCRSRASRPWLRSVRRSISQQE